MSSAKIFQIEEFATYDGPGIRMTVFLKGCVLSCAWCHNPEGQKFESEIVRAPSGCVGCGACLAAAERESGKRVLTEWSVNVCPRGLVRLCGRDYEAEELVFEIEKNIAMLNVTGGGVTFSGGEPLCHYDFLVECLSLLEGRMHRAVETCGYAPWEHMSCVAEKCELILYDLKHMDDEKHRHYTGVSNARILDNYKRLCSDKRNIITRIPLIPTVNDTAENIERTARFMVENGQRRIELLPYNKLAGGKYKLVGREYLPEFDESRAPEIHEDIFEFYGIEVSVL